MTKQLPPRSRALLGCISGILLVTCLITFWRAGGPRIELSISRIVDVHDENALKALDFRFPIVDADDDVVVVMKARNPGRSLVMFGKERIQPRADGRWLEASDVSWLNSMYFVATVPARSEKEFVIAVVPRQTEAVRVALECHEESLPEHWHRFSYLYAYNAQYADTKFPKLMSGLLLKLDDWVFSRLQRRELEVPWQPITAEFALTEASGPKLK